MCTPAQVEAVIAMFSAADPERPASTWDVLRNTLKDGFQSIDQRLQEYGPLEARSASAAAGSIERFERFMTESSIRVPDLSACQQARLAGACDIHGRLWRFSFPGALFLT